MNQTKTVAIAGMGLWTPGYANLAAWATGAPDPETEKPTGLAFDRINRRRAGPLGRALADAAAQAVEQAGVDPSVIASVVGSAIGEAATMIGLLEQMWRSKTPVSPAAFTVSVHNASSGLLSISAKNRGYATSLAADENTPAVALLEGIGLTLQRGAPTLVLCGDEEAPLSLVRNAPYWQLMAIGLVLVPVDSATPRLGELALIGPGHDEEPSLTPIDLVPDIANSPQVGILELVDALVHRRAGTLRLDRGRGLGYQARLSFEGEA